MSDEREPLWDDERIDAQIEDFDMGENARNLARHIRDDYEAQLAQTWQPLPDGVEWFGDDEFYLTASLSGSLISMGRNDDLTGPEYSIQLDPNRVRLCRLVERAEVQPAIPPDVRDTLREALEWRIRDLYSNLPPEVAAQDVARFYAALSWLDAQGGTHE